MRNIYTEFLDKVKKTDLDIAIIGDAMVDEYRQVDIKGISPEFPIPVMRAHGESRLLPGGAANVAYQFAGFGKKAPLYAFVDSEASTVLGQCGVDLNPSHEIPTRIPRKQRFYCGDFPLTRLDMEQDGYGLVPEVLCQTANVLFRSLLDYRCVIFSDYDKGVLRYATPELIRRFPISIVDPKNGNLERWRGCTVFKPNEAEALRLSGKKCVVEAGKYLSSFLGSSVVITQAGKGVMVFCEGRDPVVVAPPSRLGRPESVIGAGDCFVAFLAMSLCCGFDLLESVEIAFRAGTIYVRSKHNEPLSPRRFLADVDPLASKVIAEEDIPRIFSQRDYRLVFTNGCYDMLHRGHVHGFQHVQSKGRLIVAVNDDESVRGLKPGRPVQSLEERLEMVASCQFVDFVIPFSDPTPERLIRLIMPDAVAKGEEYAESEIVGFGIAPEIIRIPMLKGFSTSSLLDRLSARAR